MSGSEINAFCEHAQRESGSGAFLQVSATIGGARADRDAIFKVAMPSYMLTSDHDGYRSLLLEKRAWSDNNLDDELGKAKETLSTVNAIARGAPQAKYDETVRLDGRRGSSADDEWINEFINRSDEYFEACGLVGLPESDALSKFIHEGVSGGDQTAENQEIMRAANALSDHVWRIFTRFDLSATNAVGEAFQRHYRRLLDDERRFRRAREYHRVLEAVYDVLKLQNISRYASGDSSD
jgi:hypothetical protein